MPRRIREAVLAAMADVTEAADDTSETVKIAQAVAKAAAVILDKLTSEGITIQVESVAGFHIPKTSFRIRLADDEPEKLEQIGDTGQN